MNVRPVRLQQRIVRSDFDLLSHVANLHFDIDAGDRVARYLYPRICISTKSRLGNRQLIHSRRQRGKRIKAPFVRLRGSCGICLKLCDLDSSSGTAAPVGSVTVPTIDPNNVCALVRIAVPSVNANSTYASVTECNKPVLPTRLTIFFDRVVSRITHSPHTISIVPQRTLDKI